MYLALEDTRLRLQSRATRVLAGRGWDAPGGLELRCKIHTADAGGPSDLADWFAAHPGGLALIDTFQRFREPRRGADGGYADDYQATAALHSLAADHGGGRWC